MYMFTAFYSSPIDPKLLQMFSVFSVPWNKWLSFSWTSNQIRKRCLSSSKLFEEKLGWTCCFITLWSSGDPLGGLHGENEVWPTFSNQDVSLSQRLIWALIFRDMFKLAGLWSHWCGTYGELGLKRYGGEPLQNQLLHWLLIQAICPSV